MSIYKKGEIKMKKIFMLVMFIMAFAATCFANDGVSDGVTGNPNISIQNVEGIDLAMIYEPNGDTANGFIVNITYDENAPFIVRSKAINNPNNGDPGYMFGAKEVYSVINSDPCFDLPMHVIVYYFYGKVDTYAYVMYEFKDGTQTIHKCGTLGQKEFDLVNVIRKYAVHL